MSLHVIPSFFLSTQNINAARKINLIVSVDTFWLFAQNNKFLVSLDHLFSSVNLNSWWTIVATSSKNIVKTTDPVLHLSREQRLIFFLCVSVHTQEPWKTSLIGYHMCHVTHILVEYVSKIFFSPIFSRIFHMNVN